MRTIPKVLCLLALAALVLAVAAEAGHEEITKTFDKKERIRLKTISGDCVVEPSDSDKIEITVISRYSPADAFDPVFKEQGGTLKIYEELDGNTSGGATWILRVPEGTEIDFSTASGDMTITDMKGEFSANTASGDFEIENCRGEFDLSTASGDYEIENCHGEFDLSTASGDYEVEDCSGEFELSTASGDHSIKDCHGEFTVSTASGDVKAYGIVLDEESSFSTASGSVNVKLSESAAYDLDVSSASGNATLNYGGNPIKGQFEFTVSKRDGKIVSPYDFDDEEEFYRGDDKYVRKSFTKDEDSPHITVSSASGKATLKKN